MTTIDYRAFLSEATKITLYCLLMTALFSLAGAGNKTLLIVLNMAVMSAAATFSVDKKHLNHVVLGSATVIVSTIAGGIIGFYYPLIAKLLTIAYAGLAFYLPKTKYKATIFVMGGSVVFLIFVALPFNWSDGMGYAFDGLIVFLSFILFYRLFEYIKLPIKKNNEIITHHQIEYNHVTAMIAVVSLSAAYGISTMIATHFHLTHLYWIGLTILVIIQGSQQKTIQTAMKRILINIVGAIIIVCLFNYIMPPDFWINLMLLVLFLFLIFCLGFSYVGRVLFIELFVLGITHLLGDYQNAIALDRVVLTLIGGSIVMLVTPIIYLVHNLIVTYTRERRGIS